MPLDRIQLRQFRDRVDSLCKHGFKIGHKFGGRVAIVIEKDDRLIVFRSDERTDWPPAMQDLVRPCLIYMRLRSDDVEAS